MSEINSILDKKRIEDNLLNLKIISKIKENDKLSSQEKIIKIDPPSMLQGVYRWMNAEGRCITLEKLTDIVNASMEITEGLLKREKDLKENEYLNLQENNSQIFQTFIIELTNTLLGLENLKKTYCDDINIMSQLDILLKKITTRIDKMTKLCSIKI
tara:strand:- start:112 stop:582 length:471 start_codon:yes stop_codon:yes gene_type:complete